MSRPFERTPDGLYLPLHTRLSGRVRWQVLDERGVPEIPRTPSGFAVGPLEGVEQSNLITNLGLDQIASYNAQAISEISAGTWRDQLALGTGSVAPANTDTTLTAEVQRAKTVGSFGSGSRATVLDTGPNVWRHTSRVIRAIVMSADRNLAEFGFSPVVSNALGIRELFRDVLDVPVTISLLSGKTLRMDHTLTFELAGPAAGTVSTINVEEYDAANVLTATLPYGVTHGGMRDTRGLLCWINSPFGVWRPDTNTPGSLATTVSENTSATATLTLNAITANFAFARSAGSWAADTGRKDMTLLGYSNGTHTRTRRATFAAGDAVGLIYGFYIASWSHSSHRGGYTLRFDSPGSYNKPNTDTLRAGVISTWARA